MGTPGSPIVPIDLKGHFGFHRIGTGTNPVPGIAAVGYIYFDGNGKTQSYQHTSKNGTFIPPQTDQSVFVPPVEMDGTYEVGTDCTFTLYSAWKPDPHHPKSPKTKMIRDVVAYGVIVDNANELYALSMTSGNAVILVAKRMPWVVIS